MIIKPIYTRVFQVRELLFDFVISHIPTVKDKSIIVITSKIVALEEGRVVEKLNDQTKIDLIQEESTWSMKTEHVWLTLKDGMLMASAGIDESNANGNLILLPKNSYDTASKMRKQLCQYYGISNLGVLITDSRTIPLRSGVTGVALGYAGFKGIRDYRGTKDIYDRIFHFSRTNVADSLATASVFEMGEGSEQYPLAIIEGINVDFVEEVDTKELHIDPKDDMYAPFFSIM